jgi:outer membrane protein TolC
MAHRVKAADHAVALAKKAYFPDVTVSGTWIDTGDRTGPGAPSDSGQDAVMAMVSLNLPIWYERLAAGVRQARNRRLAAQADRAQQHRRLGTELARASWRLDDAQRRYDLYKRVLLPKAREAMLAIQKDYASGGSSFIDLMDAQRTLLDFQLILVRARADARIARADIHRLIGPVDPQRNPASQPVVSNKESPDPHEQQLP